MLEQNPQVPDTGNKVDYDWKIRKEAEFWGVMSRERRKGGIPLTMDFQRATRYRVRRSSLGWGDYFQDPKTEAMTPFGKARIRFLQVVNGTPGSRVLDLCCGAGWLALEQARSGKEVDAVDVSPESIEIAKNYQATLNEKIAGKINWVLADLNSYTVCPGEYDQVTVWDGLHHIQNVKHICSEINSALRPGGRLFLSERVWGGGKSTFKSLAGKYIEQLIWAVVPTPSPYTYYRKFLEVYRTWSEIFRRKVLRKKIASKPWQIKDDGYCSPFEDVSGNEIVTEIYETFDIDKVECYGGFTEEVLRSLYLPWVIRRPVILFLAWLDHLIVILGLLDGKIRIIYARKRRQVRIVSKCV